MAVRVLFASPSFKALAWTSIKILLFLPFNDLFAFELARYFFLLCLSWRSEGSQNLAFPQTSYTLSYSFADGQIKSCSLKSCRVKRNDACHQVRRNQAPSCGVRLSGRGCSIVANKTLYTLASANQNSIYIAGLIRETIDTLRQFEPELYIHWPLATKTPYTLSHR
jgi:hypothetical protein